MKKIVMLVLCTFAVSALSAQQTITSENLKSFDGVTVVGNIVAELIPAESSKIDIVLEGAEIEKLKWGIKDGMLTVQLNSSGRSAARADVRIYYADPLSSIIASGSEISSQEDIESNMLYLSVRGGAKVTFSVDAADLEVSVSGNSAALLTGNAKYLELRATEKSKVDARNLESVSVDAEATTGAEIYIWSQERLVVNAKTGSSIFYRGQPTIWKDLSSKINRNVMGASIHYIGE